MASGTITLTAYGKLPSYLNGRIVWSSVSNGTAANTSTVTAQIQISRNSSVATSGTWYGSLNIGGTTKQISYYASVGSSWVTIDTMTATVTHNADGSGNCYIYGVLNGPTGTTLEGTYVSGSATVALDQITRYATLSSATDFSDIGNPTINYSNPAGTNVTSLQACISLDGSTAKIGYKDVPPTGTSYAFPLTDSERNTLRAATPNSNSLKVYVILKTVIGSGSDTKSTTATMSIVNANPTLSPSIVDTNSTTYNVTGNPAILVANRSTASVTINAAAKKYATITSRRVEHGTQVLAADGALSVTNNPINITVTDSRGNSTSYTATNTIVPYFNPTCSIGNNMPTTDGKFSLVVSGLFYNGSIGKTSNSLTVQYRRKTANGSYGSWTNISSVTKSGNSYTATVSLTGLDYQTVYTFQVRAIDVLNTGGVASAEKAVISQPVFDWGKNDFQFNVPVYDKTGAQIGNSDTEWQNPPMVAGMEYRTTERYNGKPVYAYYTGDMGGLSASLYTAFSFYTSGVIDSIVSCDGNTWSGSAGTKWSFPFIYGDGANQFAICGANANGGIYVLSPGGAISAYNHCEFLVKYTKKSD